MGDHTFHLSRRGILIGGLVAFPGAALAGEERADELAIEDQQPFRGQTRRLKITRGSRPVASLLFSSDYPTHFRLKPELHNVCTPSGIPVTGSHEYAFIHHQSIMCGHGRVQVDGDERVVDFYRQLPPADAARSDRFHVPAKNLFQLGPSGIQRIVRARWTAGQEAVIGLDIAWQTREPGGQQGETLLVEKRIYRLASRGQYTVIDLFSRLMQAEWPATLLPENDHGYIGVRVHDLIDVEEGGRMVDSEGRVNPTEHFRDAIGDRQVPRWVDCTGRIGQAVVGMALISHPANPRNEWYLREFGLMIVSAAQSEPVRITTESPFQYAARFVAHDGELSSALADQLHSEFGRVTMAAVQSLIEQP